MKRFRKSHTDRYGNVTIYDTLNTEPVCIVFSAYHPDKADMIVDVLEEKYGGVDVDLCVCGKEKLHEWLHCGCEKL